MTTDGPVRLPSVFFSIHSHVVHFSLRWLLGSPLIHQRFTPAAAAAAAVCFLRPSIILFDGLHFTGIACLPTAFAGKVKQSVASVCLSVCLPVSTLCY